MGLFSQKKAFVNVVSHDSKRNVVKAFGVVLQGLLLSRVEEYWIEFGSICQHKSLLLKHHWETDLLRVTFGVFFGLYIYEHLDIFSDTICLRNIGAQWIQQSSSIKEATTSNDTVLKHFNSLRKGGSLFIYTVTWSCVTHRTRLHVVHKDVCQVLEDWDVALVLQQR